MANTYVKCLKCGNQFDTKMSILSKDEIAKSPVCNICIDDLLSVVDWEKELTGDRIKLIQSPK